MLELVLGLHFLISTTVHINYPLLSLLYLKHQFEWSSFYKKVPTFLPNQLSVKCYKEVQEVGFEPTP
jgi:hypothetical protein